MARVDADLDPEDYDGTDDVIGNGGSYVAEYIGAYGEDRFDRSIDELAFRAACWATGSDRVDFSNSAQELIDAELDDQDDLPQPDDAEDIGRWATEGDIEELAADPDRSASEAYPSGTVGNSTASVLLIEMAKRATRSRILTLSMSKSRG